MSYIRIQHFHESRDKWLYLKRISCLTHISWSFIISSALTLLICNGCLASNDLCMLSQGLLCAPVCRARDEGSEGEIGADCVRPRWLLFAWLCRRIQTRARGRSWVQTSTDVNMRAYSHACGSCACIRKRLPSCERAHGVWNGSKGDVSIFRQFICLDRWTSATGGKSLRF